MNPMQAQVLETVVGRSLQGQRAGDERYVAVVPGAGVRPLRERTGEQGPNDTERQAGMKERDAVALLKHEFRMLPTMPTGGISVVPSVATDLCDELDRALAVIDAARGKVHSPDVFYNEDRQELAFLSDGRGHLNCYLCHALRGFDKPHNPSKAGQE